MSTAAEIVELASQADWDTLSPENKQWFAGCLACAYRLQYGLPDIQIASLLQTSRENVRVLLDTYKEEI